MTPTLLAATALSAHQRYLVEARQLQALSLAVHIPLVCLGIALPVLMSYAEWRYLRTGDELYRVLAQRWSKVAVILFAVGVVTGTILSFELGLLWPAFMADFGAVFGLGFTLEAFSFFVEAIFLGVYVYGWGRLSDRLHFALGLPISVAGVFGPFFVISVNAWMNHPSGFTLKDGRAVDVHPWHALFDNLYLYHEFLHMYVAAFIVTGFLLAARYSWGFLRGQRGRYQRTALGLALGAACVAAPAQVVVGDWAAYDVAQLQPTKLAAMEAQGPTEQGAAEHLFGWYDGHKVVWSLDIPRLQSILAEHSSQATIAGVDSIPLAERPPPAAVNVTHLAFDSMVGIGFLLAGLSLCFAYVRLRRRRLPQGRWFHRAVLLAAPASVVALIAGWTVTDVGHQPWIVYRVMYTKDAVTGAPGIVLGDSVLGAIYLLLALALFWVLRHLARRPLGLGPDDALPATSGPVAASAAAPVATEGTHAG